MGPEEYGALPSCWLGPFSPEVGDIAPTWTHVPLRACYVPRIITYTRSLHPNVYTAGKDESVGE